MHEFTLISYKLDIKKIYCLLSQPQLGQKIDF